MAPKKFILRLKKGTAASLTLTTGSREAKTLTPHKLLPGGTLEVSAEEFKHYLDNNADLLEEATEADLGPTAQDVEAGEAAAKAWKLKLAGMKKEDMVNLAVTLNMHNADKANVQGLTDFLLPHVPKPEAK